MSRILKKGSPATTGDAAGEPTASSEAHGREIVAAAEREAENLRARTAVEAVEARAKAVAEGLAEGRAQAAALLARAAEARAALLDRLEGPTAEVAIEVARRILGRELASSPGAVVDVARRALKAAVGGGDVRLRVALADAEAIRGADGALGALVVGGALHVSEDPTLDRGEVVLELAGGRVDATIEAQLDAFRRALDAEPT